jgi:hypothetical protein
MARLYLNGELARIWVLEPGADPPFSIALSVMFDSTHFADGTEVEVVLEVRSAWTLFWYPGASSPDPVVDNKSVVYGRYDMEISPIAWDAILAQYIIGDYTWMSARPAENRLTAMGYTTHTLETSLGWGQAQHLADIREANVVYVASHGGSFGTSSLYWTDINDYTLQYSANPAGPPTFPFEGIIGFPNGQPSQFPVLPERQSANGTGLPPFNTGRPPVNLAFLMACKTGETSDHSAFLYPWGNAYTGAPSDFPEDQAYCGFVEGPYFDQLRVLAETFFNALAAGYTVHRARNMAMLAYSPQPPNCSLNVYGDLAMKLKGVYDGNHLAAPSLDWVRW